MLAVLEQNSKYVFWKSLFCEKSLKSHWSEATSAFFILRTIVFACFVILSFFFDVLENMNINKSFFPENLHKIYMQVA